MTATRTGAGIEAALDEALGLLDETARRSVELDENEQFPADFCSRLDGFGVAAYYVPTEWGGALSDHEQMIRLWRTAARRDISAVTAHAKTYLGVAPVWIAGNPEQARATADAVMSGSPVAWALSEPEHGADLLSGSVTATAEPDGYRVDGVKWPINNATRSSRVTLLARTGRDGSGRGQSLFLVDKSALQPGTWRTLPKVMTHGIRGIDISGIEFDGALLPADALIGPEGSGLETVLLALQFTRTMCTALSLGAGEHALRLAARFTAARVIQKRPLAERPFPVSVLARSAALLTAAEATSLVAGRSLHSLTAEMSVTSVVAKALAPTLVDDTLGELAELLGARSFLSDVYEYGAFQKVWRDHQIVAVFDGSTPVNRAALVQQFPKLVRGFAAGTVDAGGLAEAVSVGGPVRPVDRGALTMVSRQGCSVVQALPALVESIGGKPAPTGLAEQAVALHAMADYLHGRMAEVAPAARPAMAAYELAAAYELCYAGAACLHLWAAGESEHAAEPLWQDGLWVRAALRALLARLAAVLRVPLPVAAPGDDRLDGALARLIVDAATTGAPVTPFGAPAPRSFQQGKDSRER
ncbi:acyl-CoA dehydrogenase family protein [Kitasatospora purpeofusca]|uniref:Acyl-CoA dehydrogenase family protein n=1 Tax=Kitasatospora purpeofusca TaxID=67352 RepID=A0ABZ1TWL1_9ACTN|nr:acyl-CoA dehydrogenase family protein [Kitasatospora purpeofusca]